MSDDLTTWLRAQVEARLKLAREASHETGGHWWRGTQDLYGDGSRVPVGPMYGGEPVISEDDAVLGGHFIVVYDEGSPTEPEFGHMVANEPRAVIAWCEAELAILDEHASDGDEREPQCVRCADTHPGHCECGWQSLGGEHSRAARPYPCLTVRLIGYGYRHRPGYLEEWKP